MIVNNATTETAGLWLQAMRQAGCKNDVEAVVTIAWALERGYIASGTADNRWQWLRDMCGFHRPQQRNGKNRP